MAQTDVLEELLKDSDNGKIRLPDFPAQLVWDEDRNKSVISSISEAFPIGGHDTVAAAGPSDEQEVPDNIRGRQRAS